MTSKNPILKKYDTIAKIYNQVWLIAIIFAVGLFVMQIANGNITNKEENLEIPIFECYVTPNDELIQLESYEPQTNSELTIIEFSQIIKTKLTVNEIPPVNTPKFTQKHEDVLNCLRDEEKAIVLVGDKEVKIFPFKILRQHLIINDSLDDKPILVSFCALCNSPSVYDRNIDDKTLTFGTTGLLYRNNDLFYDDLTDSLWSQLDGRAVVGDYVGQSLTRQNFITMPAKNAVESYPGSLIMTFDTGFRRNYADSSFEDYEKTDTTLSEVIKSSKEFNSKDTILAFELNEKTYAINSRDAENDDFSILIQDGIEINTNNDNGLIRLYINKEEVQYIQSYWYVWYDHYPETIALKP